MVRDFNAPHSKWLDPRRPFAGVMRSILSDDSLKHIEAVSKVEAHRTLETIRDRSVRRIAHGNAFADEAAKEDRFKHPQASAQMSKDVFDAVRDVKGVMAVVVAAVAEEHAAAGHGR